MTRQSSTGRTIHPSLISCVAAIVFGLNAVFGTAAYAADANLAWDANTEPDIAGYKLHYGTISGAYTSVLDAGNVTTRTVTGLGNGTYYFALTAYDTSGNESQLSNEVNKTLNSVDTTPPTLSGITAGSITTSGATITWQTNEPATTQVEYGPTKTYGTITSENTTLLAAHSETLPGLLAGTVYHYRVHSTDSAGNPAVSGDKSFTTTQANGTTLPGQVIDFTAVAHDAEISLTWTNPNESSFVGVRVVYRTDRAPNDAADGSVLGDFTGATNEAMSTTHTSLTNGVTYYYSAFSYDLAKNYQAGAEASATPAADVATSSPITSGGGCGMIRPQDKHPHGPAQAADLIILFTVVTLTYLRGRIRMRRIKMFRMEGFAAFLFVLAAAGSAGAADEIHFTYLSQTAVTFDWRGSEATLDYGTTTAYGSTVTAAAPAIIPQSSAGPWQEAKITGLTENTLYHYRVGTGPDHTFKTPLPRGSSNFTIYAQGDIGDSTSYANMPVIQAMIAADMPTAFVMGVGDLTYGNAHGQAHVDSHFNDVMVWSRDVAYMPSWGNHDWDASSSSADDLRNYKGRFDLPNPQTSPGFPAINCCGEDWYWFDYGNVRFIAFPEPASGAQAAWNTAAKTLMDAAQADSQINWIVTFGHRPAYSSGHHPGESAIKGYIDALGDSHSKYILNINGHSHDYERTYPQHGVTHITAGIGGAGLEQDGSCLWAGGCPAPSYSAFRAMHQGTVKLRFTSTGIEGTFTCGPAGAGTNDVTCTKGSVVDHFTIGTVGGSDTTPPAAPKNLRLLP
ncbi:MAG: metallophosphoesterase family protein [Nitrospirae bacterium]|nr:metallophosphoesterase family protein [Nitrospirota bacterium]